MIRTLNSDIFHFIYYVSLEGKILDFYYQYKAVERSFVDLPESHCYTKLQFARSVL